jgi:hypothetical protein
MHKKIDINNYLQILHIDKIIGSINFLSLMNYCFDQNGTSSQPFKLIRRSQLRLAGHEALNAKHSQPPSLQLIKVALRA